MKCVVNIEKDHYRLQMLILKKVCITYSLTSYILHNINILLGVPPSRKDNMKSYLLDNADPFDRTYQSYTTNNTTEVVERPQMPSVSTKPNSKWEPPRNIFSDL